MGKVLMSGIVPKLTVPEKPIPVLAEITWAEVKAISDAGQAANYWAVGDTKSITINGKVGETTFSNLTIDAFIIGINHNTSVEGSNRIHFQLGKINGKHVALCDSYYGNKDTVDEGGCFNMTTSNYQDGAWDESQMRLTILGSDKKPTSPTANTLLAALPSDLRAVMKTVTKRTDNEGGNYTTASVEESRVTATTESLFLLAEFEVTGAYSCANRYEQNYQLQYDYYKAGNSKVAYKHNATGTKAVWWLRSVGERDDQDWLYVATSGNVDISVPCYCYGVSPAFCV